MYFPCSYPPFGSTFWAVPVLPAIVKPGTAAAAAVPRSLTTPRSASPICLAVSGEVTWRNTTGASELIALPSAVVIDFTMRGMTNLPPLAIAAIATIICNGDSNFVSHRNAGDRNLAPRSRRTNDSVNLTGKLNSRALAKSEATDVLIKLLLADTERELCRADVTRLDENIADAEI